MRTVMISLALASACLVGCATSGSGTSPSTSSAPAADTSAKSAPAESAAPVTSMGDPIPADAKRVPVAQVVTNVESFNGQRIAIEGVVTKMCKKKGCWFEITDGAGSPGVLVTAPKYHIFLNQGSEGKKIVAYGEFKKEVQDLAEAKHLAQDAGEPEPTEAPVKLRLLADGALFQ